MPLDPVAQQYAQTLYLARLHELSKKYSTRTAETVAALAKRGIYANTAGLFHTEMTRVGIEHIEEPTDARVDALLTAYDRAKLPIDNDAVRDINRAAEEVFKIQGAHLITQVRARAGKSGAPSGVAEAVAGTVETAMSQIKSRINYKLFALRDEAVLVARSAPQKEESVPHPGLAQVIVNPDSHTWTRGEKWTAVGVIATVVAIIVAVIIPEIRRSIHLDKPSLSQPSDTSNSEGPREPVRKPLQIVTAKDLPGLRRLNQVVPLRVAESGKTLSEIPPSSFGFTLTSNIVDRDLSFHPEVIVNSSELPNEFEIHKLGDGSALLAVYVGPETLDRLQEGLQPNESVSLYTRSWKEAPTIIGIPLSQISCARSRDLSVEESGKHKYLSVLDCQRE
jgi:hypothetical protein